MLVMVAVVLFAIPSVVRLDGVRRVLASHDLVRERTGFVELAFPVPTNVTAYTSADGRTSALFAMTNRFSEARRVSWRATATPNDRKARVLKRGAISLAAGETKYARLRVRLECRRRTTVRIELLGVRRRPAVQFFVFPIQGSHRTDGKGPYCTSNPGVADQ